MLEFILKDGSKLEMPEGCKIEEVAQKISAGLARASLAARLDGEIVEMNHVADKGGKLEFLTFADEDGRKVYRHTASHVLAQAVKRLYPNTKLAIGPAIDNGFYYDFDTEIPFTADVLEKLEAEMKKIIKEDLPLVRSVKPREEAVKYMEQKGEPYKVELINDLPEDSVVSFYTQGDFTDLCAGPHLASTGKLKAIKLTSCTGTGAAMKRIRCYPVSTALRFLSRASLTNILHALKKPKSATIAVLARNSAFSHFSKKVRVSRSSSRRV